MSSVVSKTETWRSSDMTLRTGEEIITRDTYIDSNTYIHLSDIM